MGMWLSITTLYAVIEYTMISIYVNMHSTICVVQVLHLADLFSWSRFVSYKFLIMLVNLLVAIFLDTWIQSGNHLIRTLVWICSLNQ